MKELTVSTAPESKNGSSVFRPIFNGQSGLSGQSQVSHQEKSQLFKIIKENLEHSYTESASNKENSRDLELEKSRLEQQMRDEVENIQRKYQEKMKNLEKSQSSHSFNKM